MTYRIFPFSMKRFKELEPSLKQWFNIDRHTPDIAKCISSSIEPNDGLKIIIPEEYRTDSGYYDTDIDCDVDALIKNKNR